MTTTAPIDVDNISLSPSHCSTAGDSKVCNDAFLLSQATAAATIAAKSILEVGGSEETALKTAKAAAKATLKSEADGGGSVSSGSIKSGSSFIKNKMSSNKAKRQAEVVASMALIHAKYALNGNSNQMPTIDTKPSSLSPISEANKRGVTSDDESTRATEKSASQSTNVDGKAKDIRESQDILSMPNSPTTNVNSLSRFRTWQHPLSPGSAASVSSMLSSPKAIPTGMIVAAVNTPEPPPAPKDRPMHLMHNEKDIRSVDIQAEDPIYWGGNKRQPKPDALSGSMTDDASDQLQANTSNYTSDYCTGASGSEEDERTDDEDTAERRLDPTSSADSHVSGIYDDRSEPSETSADSEDSNDIRIRVLREDAIEEENNAFGSTFLNLFSCFDAGDRRTIEMDLEDANKKSTAVAKAEGIASTGKKGGNENDIKDGDEYRTIVLKAQFSPELQKRKEKQGSENKVDVDVSKQEEVPDTPRTQERATKKKGLLVRLRSGSSKVRGFRKTPTGKQQSRFEKETDRDGSTQERDGKLFDPPSLKNKNTAAATNTSAAPSPIKATAPEEKEAEVQKPISTKSTKSKNSKKIGKKKGGNKGDTAYDYYRPYD
mmetsp:Transcript_7834/g.11266  ORF Transcript_7834/g.11266 Transcript_7834/m.11266 type:complete len:603 (-) Transcript_7834:180-1988(-)